jgi:SAM-dependent methyltransferase
MPHIKDVFGYTRMTEFSIDEIRLDDGTRVKNPFERNIDEEVESAKSSNLRYQIPYIQRLYTNEASKGIVNGSFDFSTVEDGVEFGCGMYGWLYNYLLPDGVGWKQYDINPTAVGCNKQWTKEIFGKEPDVSVGNLYEMPLQDGSVDVIAGLSCWDSIAFFEDALREVNRCLQPGGYFVHFQDLYVPDKALIIEEAKKRSAKGLSPSPILVEAYTKTESNEHGLSWDQTYFLSLDTTEYGLIRFGDYLTRHLASILKEAGYRIHVCGEKGNEALVTRQDFGGQLKVHGFEYDSPHNSFLSAYGQTIHKSDPSIPSDCMKQESFMDVLVAQKPV